MEEKEEKGTQRILAVQPSLKPSASLPLISGWYRALSIQLITVAGAAVASDDTVPHFPFSRNNALKRRYSVHLTHRGTVESCPGIVKLDPQSNPLKCAHETLLHNMPFLTLAPINLMRSN
jgi:hypothetical protein